MPSPKLPKNVRDLGKLFVAKEFKKLPKVQKIARSGHTGERVEKICSYPTLVENRLVIHFKPIRYVVCEKKAFHFKNLGH